jgi:hypothetical protein
LKLSTGLQAHDKILVALADQENQIAGSDMWSGFGRHQGLGFGWMQGNSPSSQEKWLS